MSDITERIVAFRCNICGSNQTAPSSEFGRETENCSKCRSSVRYRSIAYLLSLGLFNEPLAIPDFPMRPDLHGIGMSDWVELTARLPKRIGYLNTYYDRPPSLDLKNIDSSEHESCDFVICSEVLEHVTPPVQPAFDGIFRLLKPGGTLVLTVPFAGDRTVEHFPMLNEFAFAEVGGTRVLVNRRTDGAYEVFDKLCFHGGIGSTLEMRVFSESDLLVHLQTAGFLATVLREHYEPFGILHRYQWSLPIIARKPA